MSRKGDREAQEEKCSQGEEEIDRPQRKRKMEEEEEVESWDAAQTRRPIHQPQKLLKSSLIQGIQQGFTDLPRHTHTQSSKPSFLCLLSKSCCGDIFCIFP